MAFSFIVLFVSIFGIINTLLMSVYERTREIGLMKALGMRNIKVFQLFAIESCIIGFWGSIIGIVAATGLGSIINNTLAKALADSLAGFKPYSFPIEQVPFIIIGIVFVAFLSGTLPALKASRLDPINALKYE
jgi:putative ABC transport system permease protein